MHQNQNTQKNPPSIHWEKKTTQITEFQHWYRSAAVQYKVWYSKRQIFWPFKNQFREP